MMVYIQGFIVTLVLLFANQGCNGKATPQQVHLSLTGDVSEMVVMWLTEDTTSTSTVSYWDATNKPTNVTGSYTHYYLPLPPYKSMPIHTVTLKGLSPATKYYYICGDEDGGFSSTYTFTTQDPSSSRFTFASIGDHGTSKDSVNVVSGLVKANANQPISLLVHAGDISYANGIQKYWDIWARMVEPFAAYVPWMVGVGNHEIIDLFVPYLYRFTMPAKQSGASEGNMFYSFNYQNAHFIALSSEMPEYWDIDPQHEWLENDLSSVNRNVTPWVIAYWHSPWYCSNKKHYGSGDDMRYYFEDLFYKYKVDLVLNGHVHAYERTTGIYKNQTTPDAPVFITNGIGGTEEGLVNSWYAPPDWSVYRDGKHWGFGLAEIFNSTHLFWQQVYAELDNQIGDSFWLVRER